MTEENKSVKNFPNLLPKLRFTEFEGNLEEKALSELGSFSGGGTPSSSNEKLWKGNIPWISSSDLKEDNIFEIKINRYITQEAINKSSTKLCKAPTILIVSRVGVGKVALSLNDVCTSQDFTNIFDLKCNPLYLTFQLSKEMKKASNEVQGTSIKGISSSEIKSKKIYLPSKIEQKKIASFLSLIDKRILAQKKIIEKLETLMKASLDSLFSKKIRFNNDNSIWKTKKLKDIVKITTGKLDANAMVKNGTYRFYTCAKDHYYINTYAFDTEALLVSGNGANVGYIHYYDGKFNAYQRTYVLYDVSENIHYVKFFLDNFLYKRIFAEKKEGNTPYIVLSTLSEMSVIVPDIEEQTKIANFLSSIQEKIVTEKQILEKLELQKKFLLANLFV